MRSGPPSSTRSLLHHLGAALLTSLVATTPGCSDPEDDSSPRSFAPDPGLVAAVRATLEDPTAPEDALQQYQEELSRIQSDNDDDDAHGIVVASTVAALEDVQTLEALEQLTERVHGRSYTIIDAPSEAEPRDLLTDVCPGSDGTDAIYFINGIGNDIFAALESTSALKKSVGDAAAQGFEARFRLFYNASGSSHERVCNQLGLYATQDELSPETKAHLKQLQELHCDDTNAIRDFAEALGQYLTAAGLIEIEEPLSEDLRDIVSTDVSSGKKVVVVSHSQGNFYARQLAHDLRATPASDGAPLLDSVGFVSVASPVTFEADLRAAVGSFDLVQVRGDFITAIPGAPDPNTDNEFTDAYDAALADAGDVSFLVLLRTAFSGSPGLGTILAVAELLRRYGPVAYASRLAHGFVESYLGERTRPLVAQAVLGASASLRNDRPLVGQGYLQVMLTWDVPGDIDLHVTEPDGEHVFYSNRQGSSGQLDRDDLYGTGPENYFICERDAVEQGVYDIEINNYGGATGTQATIAVQAGDRFHRFDEVLGSPDGGQDLVSVARVTFNGSSFSVSAP